MRNPEAKTELDVLSEGLRLLSAIEGAMQVEQSVFLFFAL
jgi:hypothetical protein